MQLDSRTSTMVLLMVVLSTVVMAAPLRSSTLPPLDHYLSALVEAAQPLDGEGSADFLSPGRDPEERPTLVQSLEEIRPYWFEEDLSLDASLEGPQAFTLGGTMNSRRGGMIVWQGDIFAADYCVQHHDIGAEPFVNRMHRQPWFAWDGASLQLRREGAAERIFAHLRDAAPDGATLHLYRGTTDYEALVFELWQTITRGQALGSDWRDRMGTALQAISAHAEEFYRAYEKGLTEGWATQADVDEMRKNWDGALARNRDRMAGAAAARDDAAVAAFLRSSLVHLVTQSQFSGLFTTPSNERAKLFSKGQVVEFAFSWGELEALLRQGNLYVGLEKMYDGTAEDVQVEVGFIGTAGDGEGLAEALMKAFRGSVTAESSTLFN